MYDSLHGQVLDLSTANKRFHVHIDCGGLGFRVQVPARTWKELKTGESLRLWTYVQYPNAGGPAVMVGFKTRQERDFFETLISVKGISTQTGVTLLDTFASIVDLVRAILLQDYRTIARAPGVGDRTAERLCLELKKKVESWRKDVDLSVVAHDDGTDPQPLKSSNISPDVQEEVEELLLCLGFNKREIAQAISNVDAAPSSGPLTVEDVSRDCIAYLTN